VTPARLLRPVAAGVLAQALLLAVVFGALAGLSGWELTVSQFGEFWPFILALSAGFGLQVGLYVRLRMVAWPLDASRTVVAASGGTSAAAMVSCCTHYLANLLPILGATGVVAVVAQYQLQLFWIGLVFNAIGVVYVGRKLHQASGHAAQMR
jgi:Cu+-exporting ATPase